MSMLLADVILVLACQMPWINTFVPTKGAVDAFNSELSITGIAEFANNWAGTVGGGLSFSKSALYMDGSSFFINNSAVDDGGGISATSSDVHIGGNSSFRDNSADFGGAVYANFSDVDIRGSIDFISNSATTKGGAIYTGSSNVFINLNTNFSFNGAKFGGAIAGEESAFIIGSNGTSSIELSGGSKVGSAGSVMFIGNYAATAGGAMHVIGYNFLQVRNASFRRNRAEFGGAGFVAASADKVSDFSGCMFDGNEASDGGAVYLYTGTGVDVFTSSVFRHNFAKFAGGAIFHTGFLRVTNGSFLANKAGADGPAVMSIGQLQELSNVSFSENAYHCPAGEYGYIIENEDQFCAVCFKEICARCSTGDFGVDDGQSVEVDGLTVCEKAPPGATASSSGTTLETLVLEKGYYRTSNQSHVVLECHQRKACVGGIPPDGICAIGYKGPYCAVCTEGFAAGVAYSCQECSERAKKMALGISVVVGVVVLLVAAFVLWQLGNGAVETTGGEREVARTCWGQNRRSCRSFPMRMLPLTAVKIVVTVWQIIYQFAAIAGEVYPEVYANFVFKLTPINLDIGFMLSYSCLLTTEFYDRLLIATIMPPMLLVVLVGSYYVGKNRNRGSELAISVVKHRHQSAALFLAFWVYSSVSYTIFQTFSCDDLDDGKAYLRADYSIECSTTRHTAFKIYAWVMACVYPVGIPAVFGWCLARNRGDLAKPDRETLPHLEALNTLWTAYKPSRYWFELVECFRRIALTGIAAFVLPNSTAQIAIVLLVAVAFVFISESINPFEKVVDANLYRWGNGVIVASLYVALLLKVDLADESEQSIRAFSGVLIAANVVMIVSVLVQTGLLLTEWSGSNSRVAAVHPPVRRASSL